MARAQLIAYFPWRPDKLPFTYMRAKHQGMRRNILDHRAGRSGSSQAPETVVYAFEPSPAFLIGRSAPQLDPEDRGAAHRDDWLSSLVAYFQNSIQNSRDLDYDHTYRLSNAQSSCLKAPLDVYSRRTYGHMHGNGMTEEYFGTHFECQPEEVQRLEREKSCYTEPGQLVLWPAIDLRSGPLVGFSKEEIDSIIGTAICSYLDQDLRLPGVSYKPFSGAWVYSKNAREDRKIADVFMTVKDDILSFVLSLNVETPDAGPESVNPWSRLEAAGIDFDPVTSVAEELGDGGNTLGRLQTRELELITQELSKNHLFGRLGFEKLFGIRT
ncbi:hypothetical protein GGR54DRAFT_322169 [Hypoxylon sp. NC1633]|nr:hypothetical protein GGR54DRAFT_322169 [Hypoxylon sp. NC1633]